MVGLLFGPAAGSLVEGGSRRWASILKAASEQDSARGIMVGHAGLVLLLAAWWKVCDECVIYSLHFKKSYAQKLIPPV